MEAVPRNVLHKVGMWKITVLANELSELIFTTISYSLYTKKELHTKRLDLTKITLHTAALSKLYWNFIPLHGGYF
jgi:hypothetical protein